MVRAHLGALGSFPKGGLFLLLTNGERKLYKDLKQ